MAKQDKKKEYQSFTTPKFMALWPHLHAPDTKYEAKGVYHVKAQMDPNKPEHRAMLDALEAAHEEAVAIKRAEMEPRAAKTATVNPPFNQELDKEGNETGYVIVNFKMYATRVDKAGKASEHRPRVFDARGNPIVNPPKIGNGSTLKLSYSVSPYLNGKNVGITLYLNAVQIVELKEWSGGGDAKSYGFGAEEDGYVANEEAAAQGFGDETASDDATPADEGAADEF